MHHQIRRGRTVVACATLLVLGLVTSGCVSSGGHTTGAELPGTASPSSAVTDVSTPATMDKSRWRLTDSEDFNGTALDPARWAIYDGRNDHTGETWDPRQCSVGNGLLTLAGAPGAVGQQCGVAWKRNQTYGRWEIRVRFPFPANAQFAMVALLWPADDDNWPEAGEVDYAEEYDRDRRFIQGWLHYGEDDSQLYTGVIPVDTSQWHTYGVEWEPDQVTYFIDGKVTWSTNRKDTIPTGPMHQTLQLNINREYPATPMTTVMQVDWLHIYGP